MSPPSSPSALGFLLGAMPMLRRIISDGLTFLSWFSPGMPVRKMLAMSLRGAAGLLDPGYSTGISRATSGSRTNLPNWASSAGWEALKRSLLGQRDDDLVHQRHAEARDLDPVAEAQRVVAAGRQHLVWRRQEAAYTPMTESGSSAPVSAFLSPVSCLMGTWRTTEWVL